MSYDPPPTVKKAWFETPTGRILAETVAGRLMLYCGDNDALQITPMLSRSDMVAVQPVELNPEDFEEDEP